ncbi:myelin-oligodendrocyte glycoprotein-like isoform X2 [Astatotilapia calliptera]|uniref:myelin-oligodendrocyte glycoprotein-like isoform X2 n=1 Tax=Astatotilapia calliptera TaxID=8154 RepID=UPI000E423DFC|nr:myelin-oligodendrocyte glycoprotein-like isoform X2 [Astatotilapia calliptera]
MSVCSPLSASLWTFILCSAFSVWTPVRGEVLVIGSNLPIVAAPGDDVILPCHLEPMFDVQGLTVEWSKPDLKPDPSDRLSRVEYVHLYRDRQEVPDMKMASYFRRTELFMDDMKHGNISLKILNVSEEDNGRYRCFIPKLQSRVKAAVVELVVDPTVSETSTMDMLLLPRNLQTPDPQDVTQRNGSSQQTLLYLPAHRPHHPSLILKPLCLTVALLCLKLWFVRVPPSHPPSPFHHTPKPR